MSTFRSYNEHQTFDCMRVPCVIGDVCVGKQISVFLEGRQFSLFVITNKLPLLFYRMKSCIKSLTLQTGAHTVSDENVYFSIHVLCH